MASAETGDPDAAIRRLVEIGLTLSEGRCYVALLNSAPATAGELAEASGVPRPKVYGTLKSLERRRFTSPSGDRVTTHRPVDPDLALGELIRSREHERRLATERDRELRSELVEMLPQAPHQPSAGEDEVVMELSDEGSEVGATVEGLMRRAEKTLDIMHGEPIVQAEERWNQTELQMREQGVQVRVLFPSRELADKRRAHELIEGSCEVRLGQASPLKPMVRDNGTEAVITLRENAEADATRFLIVRHGDLGGPLQLLFNRAWRGAKPLG